MKSKSSCDILLIKSKFILKKIFDSLYNKKSLKIINYNKQIQNFLNKDLNAYKYEFLKIEIEINIIRKRTYRYNNCFIAFKQEYLPYYHIYFNDDIREIGRNYFNEDDNIERIK